MALMHQLPLLTGLHLCFSIQLAALRGAEVAGTLHRFLPPSLTQLHCYSSSVETSELLLPACGGLPALHTLQLSMHGGMISDFSPLRQLAQFTSFSIGSDEPGTKAQQSHRSAALHAASALDQSYVNAQLQGIRMASRAISFSSDSAAHSQLQAALESLAVQATTRSDVHVREMLRLPRLSTLRADSFDLLRSALVLRRSRSSLRLLPLRLVELALFSTALAQLPCIRLGNATTTAVTAATRVSCDCRSGAE